LHIYFYINWWRINLYLNSWIEYWIFWSFCWFQSLWNLFQCSFNKNKNYDIMIIFQITVNLIKDSNSGFHSNWIRNVLTFFAGFFNHQSFANSMRTKSQMSSVLLKCLWFECLTKLMISLCFHWFSHAMRQNNDVIKQVPKINSYLNEKTTKSQNWYIDQYLSNKSIKINESVFS
jgi:hypothetical protein